MQEIINESEHTKIISYFEEGDHLKEQNQYKEAIKSYKKIFELDPHNPDALFQIAYCLWKLGKNEEANLCRALIILDRKVEALEHLDLLIQMENKAEHHQMKGKNLYCLKRYEEALSTCEVALHLEPSNVDALWLKGEILIALEQYVLAIHFLDQALLIKQTSQINCTKAQALLKLKVLSQAIELIDLSILMDPTNCVALKVKGMILQEAGEINLAIQFYKEALENGYQPEDEIRNMIDNLMED